MQIPVDILEIAAYTLYAHGLSNSDEAVLRDEWQNDKEGRRIWRDSATKLINSLEDAGIGVRSSEAASRRKRLEWINTRPARAAYSLDEEFAELGGISDEVSSEL